MAKEWNKMPHSVSNQTYDRIREKMAKLTRLGVNRLPPEPDLAKELEVSRVTVRRVLARMVSERLIDRQKGRGTFIRPKRRKKNIVVFHGSHVSLFQPWMSGILRGISQQCSESNLHLELKPLDVWGQKGLVTRMISDIRSHSVDGYLIVQRLRLKDCMRIQKNNIPMVMVEVDYNRDDIPAIVPDHTKAAQLVIDIVKDRGHRRLAMITGPAGGETRRKADIIAQSFRDSLGKKAPIIGRTHIITGRSVDEGREAMRQLLHKRTPPDCIFTTDDDLAVGAMLALQEFNQEGGSKPPDMISYVNPFASMRNLLPWTVIETPAPTLVGKTAIDMLRTLIEGNDLEQTVNSLAPSIGK